MKSGQVGTGQWLRTVMAGAVIAALGLALAPTAVVAKEKVPGDKDLKALVLESLLEFNQSVLAKDFTSFHGYISEVWQEQVTPKQLLDIFQGFIDAEIDLTPVKNLEAVFDIAPKIDDDGLLVVIGHYPSRPSHAAFMLSYIKEKGSWKLIGINVQLYPPEKMVPFDPVLAKLAQETLIDFGKAVKAKDFTDFHKTLSTLWKQQITPEQLQEIFQSFIDKKVDLSGVATTEPVIDEGSAIDDDGLLTVSGTVPIKPFKLTFKLQYLLEDGKWKLAAIDVNM